MRPLARMVCVGSLIASLDACAGHENRACGSGMGAPVQVFSLFFGEAIPGRGDLTDKEWQSFLDDTVTANLPNGYTVVEATGAWMNPRTRTNVKEAAKVLVVALPDMPGSLAAIDRIRSVYQVRFHQQLVGLTIEQACASF